MECSIKVANDSSTGSQPPQVDVLGSLPLLVFEHKPIHSDNKNPGDDDEDDREILMFSISEESAYTGPRPAMLSLEDKKICFTTPQGWIFLMHGVAPWETWLWHPLTGETISLPPIQDDHYIPTNCSCLLTHSSAGHSDCAVVLLDITHPNMWFCQINGSGRWGQHTYDVGEYIIPGSSDTTPTKRVIPTTIAALGGKLHFIFSESNQDKMGIVRLDFNLHPPIAELHTREDIDAKTVFPQGMYSGVLWLLESQGELFHVCVCFWEFDVTDIGAVLVHRMDFNDGHWCRVHDIGDRVFMLPHQGNAVSCSASACNLKGNRVYFMNNLVEDDGDLCIYDLEKQAIEIVSAHEQDLTLVRTKPYWIVPPN